MLERRTIVEPLGLRSFERRHLFVGWAGRLKGGLFREGAVRLGGAGAPPLMGLSVAGSG
jgi:hypothetical protein